MKHWKKASNLKNGGKNVPGSGNIMFKDPEEKDFIIFKALKEDHYGWIVIIEKEWYEMRLMI